MTSEVTRTPPSMSRPSAPASGGTTTATHDAAERREAARALLGQPVLTAAHSAEDLALVRRHQTALKASFVTVLGYPLVVEASFARLVKGPLSPDTQVRPARRAGGREFQPRTYTYLALVCAGLLAPSAGEQVLISHLVEQLRADAATAGIAVDDSHPERRNLVSAIDLLLSWGVLVETDGTVDAWDQRQEEALLSVNRSLLSHLLARPLHSLTSPDQLWMPQADAPVEPRRSLRRLLTENPLVRREDLTDLERDALSRDRSEITRVLEETFGLMVEVRLEGALAYDPEDRLSDVGFPGAGTTRQAALLLLDNLIDLLHPVAGTEAEVDGRTVPGALAPWVLVDDNLALLAEQYGRMWRAEFASDPVRMRTEVVDLLTSIGIATTTEQGLVVHPAAARYRAQPERAPARTRARARLDDGTVGPPEQILQDQLDLYQPPSTASPEGP